MELGFQKILTEYNQLTEAMSSGGSFDMAKLGRRQSELAPIVERIRELEKLEKELEENKKLLSDDNAEIKSMALDEGRRLESEILDLRSQIEESLLPKDANDEKNIIVEMR